MLGITDNNSVKKNKGGKRKRRGVTFNDEECIINPEDIDPNVGRFRNLVQTTVVPAKRGRHDINYIGFSSSSTTTSASDVAKHLHPTSFMPRLYQDLPPLSGESAASHSGSSKMSGSSIAGSSYSMDVDIAPVSPVLGSKLGLMLPNPAPDVDPATDTNPAAPSLAFGISQQGMCPICSMFYRFGFYLSVPMLYFQAKSTTHIWRQTIQMSRERRNMLKRPGRDVNHCLVDSKFKYVLVYIYIYIYNA